MPYSYSDSYLRDRISSGGKDPGRGRTMDQWAAAARAGDQAALMKLIDMTNAPGDPNPNEHWATADAMNYGKMLLRDIMPGYTPTYDKAKDGGGFLSGLGNFVGGVLKTAAPIGAAFIPGIGPIAAGAIAAGGSAAGGLLRGEPFKLDKTLLAGAAGAGGNWLLGGQGLKGISGVPGRLGIGGGGAGSTVGNATQAMGGVAKVAGDGGGGGLLDMIGKYGPLVAGGLGMVGNYQDASKANELRERGIASAERTYAERAPFRMRALAAATAPQPQRPDLSWIFNDPGNPYNRAQRAA